MGGAPPPPSAPGMVRPAGTSGTDSAGGSGSEPAQPETPSPTNKTRMANAQRMKNLDQFSG